MLGKKHSNCIFILKDKSQLISLKDVIIVRQQ